MAIYMTKTWGFDAPCGPLQFGERGRMVAAMQVLRPGDLVVIVGTQGKETAEADRGKILGMVEPTTESVPSLAFRLRTRPEDFVDGEYRWPWALKIRDAWQFDEPRRSLKNVSTRSFGMDAASGIVALLEAEAAAILALPRTRIAVMPAVVDETLDPGVARKRAPPPMTTRRGVMFLRNTEAFTYLMSVESHKHLAYKIGWAFDVKLRERQFNRASMPELGGARYKAVLEQRWPTARQAFRMEQALLKSFDAIRHPRNSEIVWPIPLGDLQKAWTRYVNHPSAA
ncbi:GIY-YIG nuclease family protein [Inquilinus sp. CA228]|uniref:GIY-YIG nuclease family protein n=1 Tax=Inquilinus sp. CA228 TaxID=3455609 RepID=UPI003F8D12D7